MIDYEGVSTNFRPIALDVSFWAMTILKIEKIIKNIIVVFYFYSFEIDFGSISIYMYEYSCIQTMALIFSHDIFKPL